MQIMINVFDAYDGGYRGFNKLIQGLALKWVKDNAVQLVAYGVLFLVDNFNKVQPSITKWAEGTAHTVWKHLLSIDDKFAKYATAEEVQAFLDFLAHTMNQLSKHLANFAQKGNQAKL